MKIRNILSTAFLLPLISGAELIYFTATSDATLTLPGIQAEAGKSFWKPAKAKTPWQPLAAQSTAQGLKVELAPGKCAGSLLVLVNPDKEQNINDFEPPELKRFMLNGQTAKFTDGLFEVPKGVTVKNLSWIVEDAGNSLKPALFSLTLDGVEQPRKIAGNAAKIDVELEDLSLGNHKVVLRIADNAPEANFSEWTVKFAHYDAGNLIFGKPGLAKISVDSCFDGYLSLAPITDGVLELPGTSAGNDVTWASAETDKEHWIQLELNDYAILREVALYWPRLENCSRVIEVQMQRDGKWIPIATSPKGGMQKSLMTLFKLPEPVKGKLFRILQSRKGGPEGREDILWVCEVVLR